MAQPELCDLKGCGGPLGPGAAQVGFTVEGGVEHIKVCAEHAWLLMSAPRGSYRITPSRELKAIPAQPIIII